jgi:phenylacetate-CoA ligase
MDSINRDGLIRHLQTLSERSPYYRGLFTAHGLLNDGKLTTTDLARFPFTTKEQLQSEREKFIAVERRLLIDHVTTSGTTGKPVTLSLTENDLERLAQNECGSFQIAGISHDDTIQLMTTIDRRFMAGLAYFLGARRLGAGIIRVGNGIPELQWDTILEMKPTVIICVPSFLLKLIEYAEKHGIDHRKSSVRKAICIGESIRTQDLEPNVLAKKITEKWPLKLHSTYASSEMATAFTECEHGHGAHIQQNLIVAEIIGDDGSPAAEGEAGELVVTPLGVEGMPLLRFKTGDICAAYYSPCPCGRKGMRLGPVLGRKNQMIKYKGTSLYPAAIYEILGNVPEIENYQVEVSSGNAGTDEIAIIIGSKADEKAMHSKITDTFKAKLRVTPKIWFLSPEAVNEKLISAESRKPRVFVDKRGT